MIGRDLVPLGPVENYTTSELVVISPLADLITYPGTGTHNMGEGQLVPLIAQELPNYPFINWTVTTGNVTVNDPNAMHTSVVMSGSDAAVQANYVFDDLIYFNGFE